MDFLPQEQAGINSGLSMRIADTSMCAEPRADPLSSPALPSCRANTPGDESTDVPYCHRDQVPFSDGFALITSPQPVLAQTHCDFISVSVQEVFSPFCAAEQAQEIAVLLSCPCPDQGTAGHITWLESFNPSPFIVLCCSIPASSCFQVQELEEKWDLKGAQPRAPFPALATEGRAGNTEMPALLHFHPTKTKVVSVAALQPVPDTAEE